MLKKNYTKTKAKCRITFKYSNPEQAKTAALAGEFNEWSLTANPMKQLKDKSFSLTISLDAGSSYNFRYVLDDENWVNDPDADGYAINEHGEENSIVEI